jgi:long-chain acyl-CoA synthetase
MDAPSSLVDLLDVSVAAHGSRALFLTKASDRWVETSYAAFAGLVDELRAGLAALGVGPGDRVGVIAGNRVEWAVLAYAAYGRGAALVPMYESQLDRDWEHITRDAGLAALFVSTPEIRERVARFSPSPPVLLDGGGGAAGGAAGEGPSYRSLREAGARKPVPALRPSADDVACLLYTSGTTGDPKGVVLTHGNIASNVLAGQSINPVREHQRTLSFLPWAHAFGHTCELHLGIAAGATIAIAESVDTVADNLGEVQPTVLVAVPRVFQRVHAGFEKIVASKPAPVRWLVRRALAAARRRSAGAPLGADERATLALADKVVFAKARARVGGKLRFAISGAAALDREVAELIDAIGIEIYEGYGLTETSPLVTVNLPGQRKMGSVGRPVPGVRVVIDRAAVPAGAQDGDGGGEIIVYGPNVMRGYHNRPEETRAAFTADGGFRTGDLGTVDGDGYLHITGRLKEQYKLANGKYVSPGPLEERLKLSPLIANVFICGENRPGNVALVVPAAEVGVDAAAREAISTDLAKLSAGWRGYERVTAFALLEEDFTQANDMLTPSLKLKRRNIVARYRDDIERLYREARSL